MIGVSFCSVARLRAIKRELCKRGARNIGIVGKIEDLHAIENLQEIAKEGLASFSLFSMMIARGDLAVAVGWEKLGTISCLISVEPLLPPAI